MTRKNDSKSVTIGSGNKFEGDAAIGQRVNITKPSAERTKNANTPQGLSKRHYDDAIRSIAFRYGIKPALILICIFFVCAVLQILLRITWDPFPYVFTGIGGIPALIIYFKKEFKDE